MGVDLDIGIVWMLATDEIFHHKLAFLKLAPTLVEELKLNYLVLTNLVWSGNRTHIGWLNRLGFRFKMAVEHGPYKEKFFPFYLRTGVEKCVTSPPSSSEASPSKA
jgi:hypothetical protein